MLVNTNIFKSIWDFINSQIDKIGLDDLVNNIVTYYLSLDALFKVLILLFVAILLILGLFSFIKKIFKLFVVIAIIFIIYFIVKST